MNGTSPAAASSSLPGTAAAAQVGRTSSSSSAVPAGAASSSSAAAKIDGHVQPTTFHWFCGWLHAKGYLRRIYTQNIDGLHVFLVRESEKRR